MFKGRFSNFIFLETFVNPKKESWHAFINIFFFFFYFGSLSFRNFRGFLFTLRKYRLKHPERCQMSCVWMLLLLKMRENSLNLNFSSLMDLVMSVGWGERSLRFLFKIFSFSLFWLFIELFFFSFYFVIFYKHEFYVKNIS